MASDLAAITHWSNQLAPLSDERRRHALAVLVERGALAVTDLAAALLERLESSESSVRHVAIDLYHVHLPLLDDAGLLTFDAESRVAAPTESPVYESTALETGDGLDAVDALADERRRAVLAVLAECGRPLRVDELARRVAADWGGRQADDVPDDVRDRVATALHHVHLSRLRDAGAVEYDPETREATLADPLPSPVADSLASRSESGDADGGGEG